MFYYNNLFNILLNYLFIFHLNLLIFKLFYEKDYLDIRDSLHLNLDNMNCILILLINVFFQRFQIE